ncbi:MAG: hypothetical protein SNJ71_03665 [Bacteroidales bacterium]
MYIIMKLQNLKVSIKRCAALITNTVKNHKSNHSIGNISLALYLKNNRFDEVVKNQLDEWIYYFKTNEIRENFTAKGLQRAKQILKTNSINDEEYKAYLRHADNMRLAQSLLKSAKHERTLERIIGN